MRVFGFIIKNRIMMVELGFLVWRSASCYVPASCGVRLAGTALRLFSSLPPFLPLSVLRYVITRLKLSLHYMTRTIQMIDYQKHLYFCSCHNIKIIGFAKTPLDLYLFSKNFLLVIIEALFSQRLFQSPPFWLFRQPLHIFQ